MKILETHIVPSGVSKVRLSDYLPGVFSIISSRKGIKKAIKRGEVRVNEQSSETGHWVLPGEKIELVDLEKKPPKIYPVPLEVIYEDEQLAVINKPAGMVVSGNQYRTVQSALLHNLTLSSQADALPWPQPVHRLDGPTGGLLLIAKTIHTRIHLGEQFEKQQVKKQYRAIVIGAMPEKGIYNIPLNGQDAITKFCLLRKVPSLRNEWLSLVDLFPETGRTHQLRKHLANAGFPIHGDKLYGTKGEVFKGKGLFLCAVGLSFKHPDSGEIIHFHKEAPPKFDLLLNREERRWQKFNRK